MQISNARHPEKIKPARRPEEIKPARRSEETKPARRSEETKPARRPAGFEIRRKKGHNLFKICGFEIRSKQVDKGITNPQV